MKLWKFEGTAEEFNEVADKLITKSDNAGAVEAQLELPSEPEVHSGYPSVEQAVEVMSRRELSDGILEVLKALYEAGSERLSSDALKAINGYNSDQFRGLMGAFGRRAKHTLPEGIRFFDYTWESKLGQYTWTLPEPVREAMRQLKLV